MAAGSRAGYRGAFSARAFQRTAYQVDPPFSYAYTPTSGLIYSGTAVTSKHKFYIPLGGIIYSGIGTYHYFPNTNYYTENYLKKYRKWSWGL